MMAKLIAWWQRLFYRNVMLETFEAGYILWIERHDMGYSLFIPSECLLAVAQQLNGLKFSPPISYKMLIAGDGNADTIIIPRWAFQETRRLLTLATLGSLKKD